MPAPDRRQPRTDARPQKRFFPQLRSAGSGQIEMRRSPLASGGAAAVGPQSTGVCRLRGEPRQCGVRAHRLIPPSLAPTGERRPSMACLRPIPAPPRLSPSGCPWLRRCRPGEVEGNVRRSGEHHGREGRRCKGISSERYMDVPRPRVGAGRGTTRRTKSPCSGGPARSRCSRSDLAAAGPCPLRWEKNQKRPADGWAGRGGSVLAPAADVERVQSPV